MLRVRRLLENVNREGASADVGYGDDEDLVIEGPLFIEGSISIDMNGVYLLSATLGACFFYGLYCWVWKWYAEKDVRTHIESARFRLCAARGDVAGLALLHKKYPSVLYNHDLDGWSALHAAVVNGQCDSALWLLQHHVDTNSCKNDGWNDSLLHYAAEQGNEYMVKLLVEWGADVSAKNVHGTTPAEAAFSAGHPAIHDYLFSLHRCDQVLDNTSKYTDMHLERDDQGCWLIKAGMVKPAPEEHIRMYTMRAFDGCGTEGTLVKHHVKIFRYFAVVCQVSGVVYLVWRALRSLRPGLGFIYSAVFWLCELFPFILSNSFFIALWNQISRPERFLSSMMTEHEFPHVEIFIVTFNEPLSVIEPTVIACVNMDYPGTKLDVCVLDDGNRSDVADWLKELRAQMKFMERNVTLRYTARVKTKGVQHHAKAGNINSFLLKRSKPTTDFIVIFDCDMIPHPGFLEKTLGHFYRKSGDGRWSIKEYCAFTQVPQDFWNVNPSDTMVHCARFFYGPMLQGRDGAGACPCCGTGVIFNRDVLVSIGGQSYGSITEDYNTSMQLLASGFSSQYINSRLVFGMAPSDIDGIFNQRLRWAVGALQIFYQSNPLKKPGLTPVQRFLFFESASHYFLSISTLIMCIAPIIYVFTEYSPLVVDQLWELCVVFGFYYLVNRITMWVAHLSLLKLEYYDSVSRTAGVQLELWRGSQLWVWMAPNHLKAIFKATVAYVTGSPVKFSVTKKDNKTSSTWANILTVTPYIVYYVAYLAAWIYFISNVSINNFSAWQVVIYITALAWATLIVLYIWPPISLLFPRIETEEGWKISWKAFFDTGRYVVSGGYLAQKSKTASSTLKIMKSPFAETSVESAETPKEEDSKSNSSHNLSSSGSIAHAWSNLGRVALPRRTSDVLTSNVFYSNTILPEPQARMKRGDSMLDERTMALSRSGLFTRYRSSLSLAEHSRSLVGTFSYGTFLYPS